MLDSPTAGEVHFGEVTHLARQRDALLRGVEEVSKEDPAELDGGTWGTCRGPICLGTGVKELQYQPWINKPQTAV